MRAFLTKIAAKVEKYPKKLKIFTFIRSKLDKKVINDLRCHKHKKLPIKFFARVNRFRVKIFFGKLHPTGGYIFTPPSKKQSRCKL